MSDRQALLDFMRLSVLHFWGKARRRNKTDWLFLVSELNAVLGAFLDGLHFTSMLQLLLRELLPVAEVGVA